MNKLKDFRCDAVLVLNANCNGCCLDCPRFKRWWNRNKPKKKKFKGWTEASVHSF